MSISESECTKTNEDTDVSNLDSEQVNSAPEMNDDDFEEPEVSPIADIIDYLVHCSHNAFPSARVGELEPSTSENSKIAHSIYQKSVPGFLRRFGKNLAPGHLKYFENTLPVGEEEVVLDMIKHLKLYHSDEGKQKRVKNRRYRAMQKLCAETDYFSDKEMMYRNPLLYDQLVGQFLTDEEIAERDEVDAEGLTFIKMILDTVDRNHMRQTMNEQELVEKMDTSEISSSESRKKIHKKPSQPKNLWGEFEGGSSSCESKSCGRWGEFDKPDTTPSFKPEVRKRSMISAPERQLLRNEFLHEMYGSFLEGRDTNFDYDSVDNDEQYDDLETMDRDKEEEYFDAQSTENENLEETMVLTREYPLQKQIDSEDELDIFMHHLNKRKET